jgi:hypothetical protein
MMNHSICLLLGLQRRGVNYFIVLTAADKKLAFCNHSFSVGVHDHFATDTRPCAFHASNVVAAVIVLLIFGICMVNRPTAARYLCRGNQWKSRRRDENSSTIQISSKCVFAMNGVSTEREKKTPEMSNIR